MNRVVLATSVWIVLVARVSLFADVTNIIEQIESKNNRVQEINASWIVDAWEQKIEALRLQETGVSILEELLFKRFVGHFLLEEQGVLLAHEIARDGCPGAKKLLIRYYYSEPVIANALPFLSDVEKVRLTINKFPEAENSEWTIKSMYFETNGWCTVVSLPFTTTYLKKTVLDGIDYWFPTGVKVAGGQYLEEYNVVTNSVIRFEMPSRPPPKILELDAESREEQGGVIRPANGD